MPCPTGKHMLTLGIYLLGMYLLTQLQGHAGALLLTTEFTRSKLHTSGWAHLLRHAAGILGG